MRVAMLSWWLMAAACNQVFDLQSTELIDAAVVAIDNDGDGIIDPEDNCVDRANHDQADRDGDGIGDACDLCDHCMPCGVGTDHDEDRDLWPDACDNCPTVQNADQANDDGDDLGTACDSATTFERRLLFDGFGTLEDTWDPIGTWSSSDDAALVRAGPHPYGLRLSYASPLIVAGKPWSVIVGISVPATPIMGDQVGPNLIDSDGLARGLCFISFLTTMWEIKQVPVTVGATAVIRYRGTGSGLTASCEVIGNPPVAADLFQATYPLAPQLYTEKTPVPFAYVEVIQ